MNIEEAFRVLDTVLQQDYLNDIQDLVFRQSWEGQTYSEIAEVYDYDSNYIKDVGSRLWKLLSEALEKNVTKSNFKSLLSQQRRSAFVGEAYSKGVGELQLTPAVALPDSEDIKAKNQSIKTERALEQSTHSPSTSPLLRQIPSWMNSEEASTNPRQDWAEAVDVSVFYGRTPELSQLKQWLLSERCRLVAILGMEGIGKTALSVKLAEQIQGEFEYVFWRSLRDAPSVKAILSDLSQFLSGQQGAETDLPETVGGFLSQVIDYLRNHRCLLILDNAESVLCSNSQYGQYLAGHEGYGDLLRMVGEVAHQSCIVLTSREKPKEIALLEGEANPVRVLQLGGLKSAAGQEIFKAKGCYSRTESEWRVLTEHYGGNPLALKMVGAAIKELFVGNVSELMEYWGQQPLVIEDIRELLARQFSRLSKLEKEVMYWLAINREPVSLSELQKDVLLRDSKRKLPEALQSLLSRSLIESSAVPRKIPENLNKGLYNPTNECSSLTDQEALSTLSENSYLLFSLQPAVMEYVTEQLIELFCEEVVTQESALSWSHALVKPQAQDYVKDTQVRFILTPVRDGLIAIFRSKSSIEKQLNQMLSIWRERSPLQLGYTGENILNLLAHLNTGVIQG